SKIGLIGESKQVKHQLHLLVEVVQFADRSLGNLKGRKILGAGLLGSPLDLANAFQIPVEHGAVLASQFALKLLRAVEDEIQNAVGLAADRCALLGRVTLAEQLQKNLPWIVFHR